LASPTRKTSTAGLLSTLDPAELRQEVDDLAERCDELIAAHTIPGWFKRECRKRELLAVRTAQPMTVDGRLDEAVWTEAPRIEHFMDRRALRLESLETVGRLAYDDDTLYVAMECFDPNPAEIATAMPARYQHRLCDSIEVLTAAWAGSQTLAHWIVDSRGTIFDARAAKDVDGPVGYQVGQLRTCGSITRHRSLDCGTCDSTSGHGDSARTGRYRSYSAVPEHRPHTTPGRT